MARVQSKGASASTLTLDAPPTSGNRLLAFMEAVGVDTTVPTLTGWTKLAAIPTGYTSSAVDGTLALFTKIAGASESSVVNPSAPGNSGVRLEVVEYSNVNISTTPTVVTNPPVGTGTTASVTSLLAGSTGIDAVNGEVLLGAWGTKTSTVTGWSFDSSFTQVFASLRLSLAERIMSGSVTGVNPTATWTSGGAHMGGLLVRLHAAPTGAPTNTVAPAVTGTAAVGSTLTTDNGAWNQVIASYAYQWQRDGVDLSGATGSSYTVVSGDAGHTLRPVVSATNGSAQTGTANGNGTVIPSAPVNTVAPVITTDGTPATGETITVDNGTWTGTVDSYTYQWYRGATPLGGFTDWSYEIGSAPGSDEGQSIYCAETATNGGGSATANSNTIVPAVTAPLSDDSFSITLSGGTDNLDPALSIGGARGGTFSGGVSALLGPILGSVATAGGTFYRVVYHRNTHTISSCAAMKAYILAQFPDEDGVTLAVAVPAEGANVVVPALASGTTAPTGVTWVTATDYASGADFGTLTPGSWRGLYLRITVAPGAIPAGDDAPDIARWRVEGSTA